MGVHVRRNTHMAQEDVAEASGVSQKTVSNVESPNSKSSPLVTNVEKLCSYYGVSPSSILALNFSESGVEPQHFSEMITQFCALNPERRALVVALAKELATA
ncbi:MAG TPA: hypothetical protein DD667_04740 [Gammaproteobacteria bacterium]|nr:hypothetical protein [Gammaproteobacteria bacterium]